MSFDGQQWTRHVTLSLENGIDVEFEVTAEWEDGQEGWAVIECAAPPGTKVRDLIDREVADWPHPSTVEW